MRIGSLFSGYGGYGGYDRATHVAPKGVMPRV